MSITPSFSSDVVYISNLPHQEDSDTDLERKTVFFGGRSYDVIDNKIGLSTNTLYQRINQVSKIAFDALPIVAIGAAISMFLCPVPYIAASLIACVSTTSLFLVQEHILEYIEDSYPYFTVNDVEETRSKLLDEQYKGGTLTELMQRRHHNLNHLTAYLTPEELIEVFKKELKFYPIEKIVMNFDLRDNYSLRKILQDTFVTHLTETYASFLSNDDIVEGESEDVKGIMGYVAAYNQGEPVPSPTLLKTFSLIPYMLWEYIDYLAPVENEGSSQSRRLLSDRLLS